MKGGRGDHVDEQNFYRHRHFPGEANQCSVPLVARDRHSPSVTKQQNETILKNQSSMKTRNSENLEKIKKTQKS